MGVYQRLLPGRQGRGGVGGVGGWGMEGWGKDGERGFPDEGELYRGGSVAPSRPGKRAGEAGGDD